jgi:hypothetical protein
MRRESAGIESLPVVLLLGTVLATCALGLGVEAMTRAQSLGERQREIESFNTFAWRARMAGAGGLGSEQWVELELAGGKLVVDANLVQLVVGEEVLRSEVLPLPVVLDGGDNKIGGGSYAIKLQRGSTGGYFLGVRRL